MGLYQDIKGRNLVGLLKPAIDGGAISLRKSDGKFMVSLRLDTHAPWVHIKPSYEINCTLWKDILFHQIIEKQVPKEYQWAPIGCQGCYKVVVRPKTVEQLFALEDLQRRLDHPSKCGMEIRPSVFGNYGGYFYNRGLEAGLACYKKVREAVDGDPLLGPEIQVILKRGCTEIEHTLGPSDGPKWEMTQEAIEFETLVNLLFVHDIEALVQPETTKIDVRQRWIEYAYSIGDETYTKFTDGVPLYPPYVTYHHLLDELGKVETPPATEEKENNDA